MSDNKADPVLGNKVHTHLLMEGIETPFKQRDGALDPYRFEMVQNCCRDTLTALGMDLKDDSLIDTPKRVAKMYCQEIFTGLDYDNFPKCTTVENKMHYDEMICVRNITVKSMCEHHLMPFVGTASVAYIPSTRILGLSKFNRLVNFFARRPQIQERLTEQIAAAMQLILDTEDVAVVITADHFCVKMRGVEDTNSVTTTSKLSGRFRTVDALRVEFLELSRV